LRQQSLIVREYDLTTPDFEHLFASIWELQGQFLSQSVEWTFYAQLSDTGFTLAGKTREMITDACLVLDMRRLVCVRFADLA
jgi:hypothetical protein